MKRSPISIVPSGALIQRDDMMNPIRYTRTTVRALLLLAFLAVGTDAFGHGGEDHGDAMPAPASAPGVDASLLTTSGATEQFELLLKYAPPHIGEDARVRLFLADYATNRAIEGASFTLAFKPAGVVVVQAPKMTSPGIYEGVMRFPRDTIYNLVATVTAGGRTDFLEVRNVYAGDAATRFIAEHAGPATQPAPTVTTGTSWWMTVGLVVVILGIIASLIIIVRRIRFRRRGTVRTGVKDDTETTSPDEQGSATIEDSDSRGIR
jgi:membrane fusion protein, heavy metal efflux system